MSEEKKYSLQNYLKQRVVSENVRSVLSVYRERRYTLADWDQLVSQITSKRV